MADKKTILIIDDDPDIVEAMRMPLEAHDYRVISASNGDEGLRRVVEEKPNLIILDVMMTTTTEGFHVAYALRNEDPDSRYREYRNIPILIVTAISQYTRLKFSTQSDGDFLPVDDFIEKPIDPEVLLSKVGSFINP